MSARRRRSGAWLAGARDGDDLLAGRPAPERAGDEPGRFGFDDEPGAAVVRAARSRRDGWNRHVPTRPDVAERARSRSAGRALRTLDR